MSTIIDKFIEDMDNVHNENIEKQSRIDKNFIHIAEVFSKNSYALRRKVGCILVKNKMIISNGYNGTLPNMPNECEYFDGNQNPTIDELNNANSLGVKLITKDNVMHAEQNAIAKCARNGVSCEGATAYCTLECCESCAKLMIMSGIKRFVYKESYRCHDGIELLKRANVEVKQIQ